MNIINNVDNKFLTYAIMMLTFFMFFNSKDLFIQYLLMEFATLYMIMCINKITGNKMVGILIFTISSFSTFFVLLFFIFGQFSDYTLYKFIEFIFYLKLGMFPFYNWNLYVYNNLNWYFIFFISTYNKFFLISLLFHISYFDNCSIFYLILNSLLMSLISYGNFQLKKLIACSTVIQSSMMILIINFNYEMFCCYFLLYTLISYYMYYLMYELGINSKKDLILLKKSHKTLFIFLLLIYICLPPFFSFVMKWILFYSYVDCQFNLSLVMMLLSISNILMFWGYFSLLIMPMLHFSKVKIKYLSSLNIKYMVVLLIMFSIFLVFLSNYM